MSTTVNTWKSGDPVRVKSVGGPYPPTYQDGRIVTPPATDEPGWAVPHCATVDFGTHSERVSNTRLQPAE